MNIEDDFLKKDIPHNPPTKNPKSERETIGLSKYWQMMESRKKAAAEKEERNRQEQEMWAIQALEKIPPDELQGKRIHSWVLVIFNAKEIKFVETASGNIYELNDSPYLSIESLWNHLNYWVNMKPIPLSEMIFDLANLEYWEHLLVAEPWHLYSEKLCGNDKRNARALKHFTMPSSWVPYLKIPQRNYIDKYPQSCRVIMYKKIKVEKFSENFHHDGTILRLTAYDDYSYENPIRVVDVFHGRMDSLKKMKKDLQTGNVQEYFDFGRNDFLQKHEYFQNGHSRCGWKMEFYSNGRLDNLLELRMFESQLNFHFRNRQDRIKLYTVEFESSEVTTEIENLKNYIKKIITKYDESEASGVEFREFREDEIRTTFRYKDREIIQERIILSKGNGLESTIAKIEQKCRNEVVQLIHEVHSILGRRYSEKENINVHKNSFRDKNSLDT